MADGLAMIEINHKGEGRLKELNWFDFRLENVLFHDAEGVEQLVDQLPEGINDVLVLVVFNYVCHCSKSWEGEFDCDEIFNLVSHQILKPNYKEFYREIVTEKLNMCDILPDFMLEDTALLYENDCKELVSEWEEFYDEDFKPYVKEILLDPFNFNI